MTQTIILFDIDYTLFDAYEYRVALIKKLATVCDMQDDASFFDTVNDLYLQVRQETGFEPGIFAQMIIEQYNLPLSRELLENSILEEGFIDTFVYPEAHDVLQKLSKKKRLAIGIFSGGRVDLQIGKVTNVIDFFNKEHVHIIREKKEDALKQVLNIYKNQKILLVDDVLAILHKAKMYNPKVFTIWSKRGRFALKQEHIPDFEPDAQIMDLRELLKLTFL